MRQEHDSIGAVDVPAAALWGAQTQRSLNNFAIGHQKIPAELIHALARIKQCCAAVNGRHGLLNDQQVALIERAGQAIQTGQHDDHFPLSVWQTGSGTQTNMNVNEVISNLAAQESGENLGSHRPLHPNDHINRSQSTNDVFPAAIHVAAALQLQQELLPELKRLIASLDAKAAAWQDIIKIGRTHLQDAVPLRLSDEVSAWRDRLSDGVHWLTTAHQDLLALPLGGTAVGSGLNTPDRFAHEVCAELASRTGSTFQPAKNLFAVMAGHDALVQSMAQLRRLAVTLLTIANDIRLLACGPRAGLGELLLPANEPGSSIMPGKVNPTQCEAVAMATTQVMGMDQAVAIGGSAGHLQMNVYKPLLGLNLLRSGQLLTDSCRSLEEHLVRGMDLDHSKVGHFRDQSLMLVTALAPVIGYDMAAKIALHAHSEGLSLKQAALALEAIEAEAFDEAVNPGWMAKPHD